MDTNRDIYINKTSLFIKVFIYKYDFIYSLKQLATENWPAPKLHVELVYIQYTEFSMSHMVSNGLFNFNSVLYIYKDIFIDKNFYK